MGERSNAIRTTTVVSLQLHDLGMRLAQRAGTYSQRSVMFSDGDRSVDQYYFIEACRNAGAAAKVLATVGQLASVMDRLKHGAR